MAVKFFVEQVALCPPDPKRAIALLTALGLTEWTHDVVVARGQVGERTSDQEYRAAARPDPETNVARLAFNYQATRGITVAEGDSVTTRDTKPLELEVLHYDAGANWMQGIEPSVSHFGMHCTEVELYEFRQVLKRQNIGVVQEVTTISHVNPAIAGKRWYKYVIFNTRPILGVDLKFIVRLDAPASDAQ